MGTNEKSVQLKVFIDEKEKKVMFAEAGEDFVDILLSFFTLPLGTIARLARKHADSKDIKVGSLTSLYDSVVNLNVKHFSQLSYKDLLVNPINSSASLCQKLKVNLDETKPINPSVPGCQGVKSIRFARTFPIIPGVSGCESDPVIVKSMANFIITDDFNVVPVMFDRSIVLLNSLGVQNINLLEERTLSFGLEEFLNLLKWSLLTTNPLTSLVLGGGQPCSSFATNSTLSNCDIISTNSGQTQTLKLLVQKSNKKLLCAQVERLFVELLFSFLTIPLGAFIHLTNDGSYSLGISNLYNSISCLGDGKYLKSEEVKNMLLSPKLSATYSRVTDFLPIYEVNTRPGHFLKEHTAFQVSNDLEVTACPPINTISKCNALGVPVGDMEVLEVSFGEHEALLLLKASLTSTSALTDFLNSPRKKPKVESST